MKVKCRCIDCGKDYTDEFSWAHMFTPEELEVSGLCDKCTRKLRRG